MRKQSGILAVLLCAIVASAGLGFVLSRNETASLPPASEAVGEQPLPSPAHAPSAPLAVAAPSERVSEAHGEADEAMRKRLTVIGKRATAPLARRWSEEARDPRWNAFRDKIAGFFENAQLEGVELVSVDCRTTLCRYELAVDDRRAIEKMLDLAREERAFDGAMGIPVFEDDRFTVYLAPPGVPLIEKPKAGPILDRAKQAFGIQG